MIKNAYFAGGCFWCMAKPYYDYDGVKKVISGYVGGFTKNPTYEVVKEGKSGYLETVNIEYDNNLITYGQLLDIYFMSIDPFDNGGQFIDRGENYTCCVFYDDDEEKKLVQSKIKDIEKQFNKKCYVETKKITTFYMAEEYHQDYHLKNPLMYKEEFMHSGRIEQALIGKFKYQKNYYEIHVLNGKIIEARETKKFDTYDNPKSIKPIIREILEGIKKIKSTIEFIGKTVDIKIDRKIGSIHPKHEDLVYKINYGYVPLVMGGDNEELDAYVLGEKNPLTKYKGKCIALIHRLDEEDDKLIITRKELSYSASAIRNITHFQEQYHKSIVIMPPFKNAYKIKLSKKEDIQKYLNWEYDYPFEDYNLSENEKAKAYLDALEGLKEKHYFSVFLNDVFIGICVYHFVNGKMQIGFGLAPLYTSIGLGEDFIEECINFGRRHYHYDKEIILEVLKSNKVANKIYEKIGFTTFKQRKYIYNDKVRIYNVMRRI